MVTLEELKTILQDYAAKTVTYDRLKAKEHDEQDGWRYVLLSECPLPIMMRADGTI